MKKVSFIIAIAIFSVGALVSSCSDDGPVSCTQKLLDVTDAQSNYLSDPESSAFCNAYKDALEDYINCDGIANKDYYQEIFDGLQCL